MFRFRKLLISSVDFLVDEYTIVAPKFSERIFKSLDFLSFVSITEVEIFFLSNPSMKTFGLVKFNCFEISLTTSGIAVAVNAEIFFIPNDSQKFLIRL